MKIILSFLIAVLSVCIYFYKKTFPLIDVNKCPYCFGKNVCDKIQFELTFTKIPLFEQLHNFFNVKNVFFGHIGDKKVVLKKLGHNNEFKIIDDFICVKNNINCGVCEVNKLTNNSINYLTEIHELLKPSGRETVKNFLVCTQKGREMFLNEIKDFNEDLEEQERLISVWSILKINAEPLILHLLNKSTDKWPIPVYLGACGRIIAESYNGTTLGTTLRNLKWSETVYVGLQLLKAAIKFTEGDGNFRYYLTDISVDNLAVDSFLNLTFIDLENVIMVPKSENNNKIHVSGNLDLESDFSYSEAELCDSTLSDHNIYAVCKLILSEKAPYPMTSGGLLNKMPTNLNFLRKDIELCASSSTNIDRFLISKNLIKQLQLL